ncbi:MAG: phosphotransferase [Ilumatobacteraceae bacterium]
MEPTVEDGQMEVVRHALRHWGLDAERVAPAAGGATNAVYEVGTAGAARWFLRRYRRTDPVAVEREHGVIAHAAAGGVPTPQPVPAASGGSTVVHEDGSMWALFPAATGRQFDDVDVERARAAGTALARLHLALVDLDAAALGLPAPRLSWSGPDWIARLRRVLAAIDDLEHSDEVAERARERISR